MSGIEIAGLVFAGIAAYKCCHDLHTKWRKKRAEKKRVREIFSHRFSSEAEDSLQLSKSLATGEPCIREEYDRDYRVLGDVFKAGDGMYI